MSHVLPPLKDGVQPLDIDALFRSRRPKTGWFAAAAIVIVIGTIFVLQTWAFGEHRYELVPGKDLEGEIKYTGLKQDLVLYNKGVPRRLINQSSFTIGVSSPNKLNALMLDLDVQGTGRVYADSWRGNQSVAVLVYDSGWANYTKVAQFENREIYVRSDQRSTHANLTTAADIYEWLEANIPEGTTLSDENLVLDWSRFENRGRGPVNKVSQMDYALRSTHSFYIRPHGSLTVSVHKSDLNMYDGADNLTVELYNMVGDLVASQIIADDGVVTNSGVSIEQEEMILFPNLPDNVYRLVFKDESGGNDFVYDITLNAEAVIEGRIFAIDPVTLYLRCTSECSISAQTWHAASFQDLIIDNSTLSVDERGVPFNVRLSAGNHTIIVPRGDVLLSGFDIASLDNPAYFTPSRYSHSRGGVVLVKEARPVIRLSPFDTFEYHLRLRTRDAGVLSVGKLTVDAS